MPTPARTVLRALALILRFPGRLLINSLDGMKARNGVGPLNKFQRGAVHGFAWLCALIFFSMAITTAPTSTTSTASSTRSTTTSTDAARPTSTPTTSSRPAGTAPAPAFGINPETVTVAEITDGDTFQLTDGRKVRVLGIDSCEDTGGDKTPGGAQGTIAASVLDGQQVILTTEPGVEFDSWGRILRYVWSAETEDFGVWMVRYDHTGVYQGDGGDASQAYLDELYAHDLDHAANPPSGRECGEYPPPVPAPSDDDANVPVPDNDDDNDRDRDGRFCGRWNPVC